MATLLEYATNWLIFGSVCFVLGVAFSQRVKDFLSGVPAEVRSAIAGVETKVKADIAAAQASVIAQLPKIEVPIAPPPAAPPTENSGA